MSLPTPPTAETEDLDAAIDAVRDHAEPVVRPDTVDRLADRIGDAPYVLLGEASHGTSEYYRFRARLTARLVRDHGFSFVAAEADWTDIAAVDRYVAGSEAAGDTARAVLAEFERWPTWMWANWEVVEFVEWLREFNADRAPDERVGVYGLDVYGLYESMHAVVDYLEDRDSEAADRARDAYRCFEPYGEDAREYARSIEMVPDDCEDEVIDILRDLREREPASDSTARDAHFAAEQNALVARNAEEYYRAMVRADTNSWNVRDRHMVETLERLMDHHGPGAKGIVWAHNTHVGDARATDMARRGEINIGQLVREAHGAADVQLVGFGSHRGTVAAADRWGADVETMRVPEARAGSYEDAFHRAGLGDALLIVDESAAESALGASRGHRAIGVVYHPEREAGNYVPTTLTERYDAFVYLDETAVLHPLHPEPHAGGPPDTYPWGV